MSEPTCCGKLCVTPFCPQCGQAMQNVNPILGLLAHVKVSHSTQKALLERIAKAPRNTQHRERHARFIAKRTKTVEKWAQWESALSALITLYQQ